jgi:Protein of unknown function (DUF2591)
MKTSELKDTALDWAVKSLECEGCCADEPLTDDDRYSTNWAQGGPIIERERISVNSDYNGVYKEWMAESYFGGVQKPGPTPLVAAMRCYVASKLGDEVDVPEELV